MFVGYFYVMFVLCEFEVLKFFYFFLKVEVWENGIVLVVVFYCYVIDVKVVVKLYVRVLKMVVFRVLRLWWCEYIIL